MKIHIFTLFPKMFSSVFAESIIKRAQEKGLIEISLVDIREFTHDKHHTADDYAYGGGAGMVMKPEPIFEAVESVTSKIVLNQARSAVILTTPQGRVLDQSLARELSQFEHLLIICGHYEGVDERVRDILVTHEISIGDYVLTGGELPAMVMVDAVTRLIPGVLGSEISLSQDSFSEGLLQYPEYTRPPEYRGMKVPEVLLSGNPKQINEWNRRQAILRTARVRPDLLGKVVLSKEEKAFLTSQGFKVPDK